MRSCSSKWVKLLHVLLLVSFVTSEHRNGDKKDRDLQINLRFPSKRPTRAPSPRPIINTNAPSGAAKDSPLSTILISQTNKLTSTPSRARTSSPTTNRPTKTPTLDAPSPTSFEVFKNPPPSGQPLLRSASFRTDAAPPLISIPSLDSEFGSSIAFSRNGKILVAGAPNDKSGTGSVYLYSFQENSNSVSTPIKISVTKTVTCGPLNACSIPRQGTLVAISGGGEVIAASGPGDTVDNGAVFVWERAPYRYSSPPYIHMAKLTLPPPLDSKTTPSKLFARAIALAEQGGFLAVGAPGEGSVYMFKKDNRKWVPEIKLDPPGVSGNSAFGTSIALSSDGSLLAIGDPTDESHNGAVWVFIRNSYGVYVASKKKISINPAQYPGARFGTSLALSSKGDVLAVGAPMVNSGQGSAFLFTRADGSDEWVQRFEAVDTSAGLSSQGQSVSLSGDGKVLIVGSTFKSKLFGAATVYSAESTGYFYAKLGDTLISRDRLPGAVEGATSAVGISSDGTKVGLAGWDSMSNGVSIYV